MVGFPLPTPPPPTPIPSDLGTAEEVDDIQRYASICHLFALGSVSLADSKVLPQHQPNGDTISVSCYYFLICPHPEQNGGILHIPRGVPKVNSQISMPNCQL